MATSNDDSLHAVVARFESDWKAGKNPRIISFLSEVEKDDQEIVLRDLIAIDINNRKSTGRRPSPEDYLELGTSAVGIAFQQLHESVSNFDTGDELEETAFDPNEKLGSGATKISTGSKGTITGSNENFIGPYKLIEPIGEGGMGTVWLAEQQEPVRRRVALKVIREEIGSSAAVARFEAERQAIALMEHQNIAKILDAGTTESGTPFFAMELVDGEPLNDYCIRNKLSVRKRLELMIPVCRAIHHAHQKGIIHRDLKHSNVLVTQYDGEAVPKVIDFGLAKAFEHQAKLTEETIFTEFGRVVGTLQYMSPEQAELSSVDVDTRTDIYALGVMIYKLLTGTTPLNTKGKDAKKLVQILELIRDQDPQKPSDRLQSFDTEHLDKIAAGQGLTADRLIQEVKTDVDWIVMKAIEKDRERRYQSANGLALDIDRFLNDEEVRACPPSTVYRIEKFYKRNRKLVFALAAIASVLVLGAIGTSIGLVWAVVERNVALVAKTEAQTSQAIAETRLRANQTKSAYSDWQLGNVESAWLMLNSLDKNKIGWESQYLKSEFSTSTNVMYGHALDVHSVASSPDGRFIASTSPDYTVKVWDAKSKTHVRTIKTEGFPHEVRFSSDSAVLAYSDRLNRVVLHNAIDGNLLEILGPFDEDILCFSFLDQGRQIVLGTGTIDLVGTGGHLEKKKTYPPVVRIINMDDGGVVAELTGHTQDVVAVDCSSDGEFIVSCSLDSTIRIWHKVNDQFELQTAFEAHKPEVLQVKISPDNQSFVSCGGDSTARLWELETGKLIRAFIGHKKAVNGVAFNSDGSRVVTGSNDGTARIWDLGGQELLVHQGHFSNINKVCFSHDDLEVVSASDDKTLRAWNAVTNTSTLVLRAHADTVWQTDFSLDGTKVITVSEDGTVCLFDARNGILVGEKFKQETAILCVAQSPKENVFVTGSADSKLRVFDSADGHLIETVQAHGEDYIWDADFSHDGKRLVTASSDNTIKIWNTSDWSEIQQVTAHNGEVASARFSNDDQTIVTASDDSTVKLWDASTFELLKVFNGHKTSVWRAIFSPTDPLIASSGYDGEIILWDLSGEEEPRVIAAHQNQIAGLVFSTDGTRLVSASDDTTIRIWDVESGIELFVLRDKDDSAIVAASFSQDGARLVTGNMRGWVTIRTAGDFEREYEPFLPQDAIMTSVNAMLAVTTECKTDEDYLRQQKIAENVCNHFPYYLPFTVCGVSQYRRGEFENAIESLEEAQRLEPLIYGEPDLVPNIEGYLVLAYLKTGRLEKALNLKPVFIAKCDAKTWNDFERVAELRNEVESEFQKITSSTHPVLSESE